MDIGSLKTFITYYIFLSHYNTTLADLVPKIQSEQRSDESTYLFDVPRKTQTQRELRKGAEGESCHALKLVT